jgi:hypothetical protein
MKHYRIKKKTHRIPVFIPGLDGQMNLSDLIPPRLPRLMVWEAHLVKWIVWEEPQADLIDASLRRDHKDRPSVRSSLVAEHHPIH